MWLVYLFAWIGAAAVLCGVLLVLWAVGVWINDRRIYRSWAMQSKPRPKRKVRVDPAGLENGERQVDFLPLDWLEQ